MENVKGIAIDLAKIVVGVLIALKVNEMLNKAKITTPTPTPATK